MTWVVGKCKMSMADAKTRSRLLSASGFQQGEDRFIPPSQSEMPRFTVHQEIIYRTYRRPARLPGCVTSLNAWLAHVLEAYVCCALLS